MKFPLLAVEIPCISLYLFWAEIKLLFPWSYVDGQRRALGEDSPSSIRTVWSQFGVRTSDWTVISEQLLNQTVLCKSYQVFLRDDSVGQDNMKQLKWQRLQKARTERGRYEPFYKIVRQWPRMEFIDSSLTWLFWPKNEILTLK